MLMPERNEAMQQRLALTLDRIASYSALLSKKEHSWQTHVDNALTALDARDETSLPALYSEIQKLTDKIDKHT